jgi:hypothetical protein
VVTGRLKAQRLGLGSQGQLGLRLSRPARAGGLAGREGWLGSDPSRAGFLSSVGRTCRFIFSSSRPGGFCSSLLLTDRLGPGVGVHEIKCGGAGSGAKERRACVHVGAEARVRVWAPEGHSGKCLNGLAATLTRRRDRVAGVDAHGKAVAQARLGWGAASMEAGTAGSHGQGAHARARVLASQGRGVAVPCAGLRHPGPAARRGGGKATAVAGEDRGATGSCTKMAQRPEGEGWSYGWLRRVPRRR